MDRVLNRWLSFFRMASRKSILGCFGLSLLLILVLFALLGPIFFHFAPNIQNLNDKLKPPGYTNKQGNTYLLGTDYLGRDILSRIVYGLRISLVIGLAAASIAAIAGTLLGLISGYFGGWVDGIIMRLVDVQLSFPFLLLALMWVAFIGEGLVSVIIAIALVRGWVDYTRIVRGCVLSVKEAPFIEASKALGANTRQIIFKHIFPQVVSPIIVVATFQAGRAILLEATLSFLGLGVPPMMPTLGRMLSDARHYVATAWWFMLFPGMGITLIVLSVNALGDGLRDILDPKLKT